MNQLQFIENQTKASLKSISATLKLLAEDCTIPFISRYRKDKTGNLDEVVIEQIDKLNKEKLMYEERANAMCIQMTEQMTLLQSTAMKRIEVDIKIK
jgi:uncharacterized protein